MLTARLFSAVTRSKRRKITRLAYSKHKHVRQFHANVPLATGIDTVNKHRDTPWNNEDTPFEFNQDSREKIKEILKKYPETHKRAALGPVLDITQRQNNNWLSLAAMNKVAKVLKIPPMLVYEFATFYTMFNRQPVGKHFIQVCGTTPCELCGAREIFHTIEKKLGIKSGQTTSDGLFTVLEVECLGACVNAPMLQIGDDYYEDLKPSDVELIIDQLARGEQPKPGPYNGRKNSIPVGGRTSLSEEPLGPYAPYLESVLKAKEEEAAKASKEKQQQTK
eukprot:TRINITY_DN9502_c0_g1_i1.p1 TRINITY_DN9502_c0_g1~~TRINITY_DN9502_c0_g1_i1.p1  ORF type:complete len:291 (-),score=56.48 TRINITY_DN9502_c0_g1_i1:14-847(-)